MIQKKDWDYVYVVFDGDNSGQLRYNFYHEYKKDRDKNYASSEYDKKINEYVRKVIEYSKRKNGEVKKTNPYDDKEEFERMKIIVNKMLEELFIRQYSFKEVEGDDVIAYYVAHKLPNEKIVIMSGDRDLSQLISDNVTLYDINLKKFITEENFKENYGYHYSNVVTVKIMVGDSSDSIYGVERLGKPTLFEHFPEVLERHVEVDEIVRKAKELNEKRVKSGKKPLKIFENIENSVTKGSQGKRLYEINRKLIDLSTPLLTEEAENELNETMRCTMDSEGRSFGNLFQLVTENGINEWMDSEKFSNFFSSFNKLITKEKKREADSSV